MANERPDPSEAPAGEPGFLQDVFQVRYREVTVSAVLFAVAIGVVMNAAITYAGLKIGFTIGGSAIAAVLGFGVLRGLLRRGTILETNIAQTVASAVNTSNSGVIFTVPVLFLLGYEMRLFDGDFWTISLAAVAGAMLGTVFIIPLRKQMLDIERLRFPSPTGVATILKSPGAGAAKSIVLLAGCLLGAAIYLPAGIPSIRYEAAIEDLDALVERGRLAPADRDRTLRIAEWIESRQAPPEVVAAGAAVREVRLRREAIDAAKDASPQELAALREALRDREAAAAAALAGLPWSDELAVRAHLATEGDLGWEALRDRRAGWASRPWFGYADLPWTFGESIDEDATAQARAADAAAPAVLSVEVDRNRDGRPDRRFSDAAIDVGRWLGLPGQFPLIFAIAPFALGAGYITGRAGLFVLAGGILAYFVITPLLFSEGWMPAGVAAWSAADFGRNEFTRPLGIGLLLGGALMGVLFSLPAIREAVKSIAAASRLKAGGDEIGLRTILVTIVLGLAALFVAADLVGGTPVNPQRCPVTAAPIDRAVETAEFDGYTIGFASAAAADAWRQGWSDDERQAFLKSLNARPGLLAAFNPHLRALLIALVAAAWIWFAGIIISQCAGMTDWSPISGMSLLTVVLVLMLAGSGALLGAVLLGAALCVAITLAADMMGDLKTGYLVGAKPKRQQFIELCVVWMGPLIAMVTLMVIVEANRAQFGVAIGPGTDTPAPQAMALQAVITGVQGGEMPYALYGFGALLGGLLGLGAFSGLGVLVGISMFLPFAFIATYGVGCLINMAVARIKGRSWAEAWGVPFAAGLIVGDAMLALLFNIVVLAREA